MVASSFKALDYTLAKEYETILFRKACPPERSSTAWLLFNELGQIDPTRPLLALGAELIELLGASKGEHKNKGHQSVRSNVGHEIADCLFYLMVLDVSLGTPSYEVQDWASRLAFGMSRTSKRRSRQVQNMLDDLKGAVEGKDFDLARSLVSELIAYLGGFAADHKVSTGNLVAEIHEPRRWSYRPGDSNRGLNAPVRQPRRSELEVLRTTPDAGKPAATTQRRLHGRYEIAENGPFQTKDRATVIDELDSRKAAFAVWIDEEWGEYLIDGVPADLSPDVKKLARYLLATTGGGEVRDDDVATEVMGYNEYNPGLPIKQLYARFRQAFAAVIGDSLVTKRKEKRRIFRAAFSYCWLEPSR